MKQIEYITYRHDELMARDGVALEYELYNGNCKCVTIYHQGRAIYCGFGLVSNFAFSRRSFLYFELSDNETMKAKLFAFCDRISS